MRLILIVCTLISPAGALAENATPPPANAVAPLPVPPGAAMILNSGSADLAGYRVVIAPDGTAVAVDGAGKGQRQLSADLTHTLFLDLAAAAPLSRLPSSSCAAGAAAVTPIVVSLGAETSPELTCPSDPKATALLEDIRAITRALYVTNYKIRAVSHFGGTGQAGSSTDVSAPVPVVTPAPSSGGMGGYGHT
jgi:hypothetical protein